jgi:hypothetical protein
MTPFRNSTLVCLSSAVVNLSQYCCAVFVYTFGQFRMAFYLPIIPEASSTTEAVPFRSNVIVLRNDEPPTAFSFSLMVSDVTFSSGAVFVTEVTDHSWDGKTILNSLALDSDRTEDMIEHGSPPLNEINCVVNIL